MGTARLLSWSVAFMGLSFPAVFAADGGSATLKTSVRFPGESSDSDQLDESSNIDQVSSPSHATSSSSFALIGNAGNPFTNHQRDDDKLNQQGYSQGFIFTSGGSPLQATTYGPPSPVGLKYRMRRPVNPQHNTNIQHRFRGAVLPGKLPDIPLYKGHVDPLQKHPFAVQHDVTPYRKYYKKPSPELSIRKPFKPKSPVFNDPYNKNSYEENFSKSTSFDEEFNKRYQNFPSDEKERPYKSDDELDRFAKPFFDNFFSKPTTVKDSYLDSYFQTIPTSKPPPAPARNLSKYYKKPVNIQYFNKDYTTDYKSPGQIFSEPLDYARPHYKSLSSIPLSSPSQSSGEWTPINAPQGAVPAKSYDIPAPDLSQDKRNNNLKRGTYEDALRHDVIVGTKKFNKAGNSEEVVSAVVMVKQ